MRITIEPGRLRLLDAEDFTRFDIVSTTDRATARALLHGAGAGTFASENEVAVPLGWVRFAAGAVSETAEWRSGFDKMLGYAASKGWITEDGEIVAHVVWQKIAQPRYRVAVVGLGVQGSGIAKGLQAVGHEVVAGVDVGDRVGRRLAEVVEGLEGDAVVLGSVEELIQTHPDVDVVALAAAVHLDTTLEWAGLLVERGINVVTLDPEAFSYHASWVTDLDARAKKGGGSFMGVGVQDVAWVQLITLAGAVVRDITKISLTNLVPMEVLSTGLLTEMGVGLSLEEHEASLAGMSEPDDAPPSLVGAPLLEVARQLGAAPGPLTTSVDPVLGGSDYAWVGGDRTLRAGTIQGIRETASFETDLGITFEGVISVVPGGEEVAANVVEIEGDPNLRVSFGPITTSVTDTALIARIPDVVAAPPGAVFSADLAPARHQWRARS